MFDLLNTYCQYKKLKNNTYLILKPVTNKSTLKDLDFVSSKIKYLLSSINIICIGMSYLIDSQNLIKL